MQGDSLRHPPSDTEIWDDADIALEAQAAVKATALCLLPMPQCCVALPDVRCLSGDVYALVPEYWDVIAEWCLQMPTLPGFYKFLHLLCQFHYHGPDAAG